VHPYERAKLPLGISKYNPGTERPVPLNEDGGAYLEGLARDGLRGALPALHNRLNVKDRDASDHPPTVPVRNFEIHAAPGREPKASGRWTEATGMRALTWPLG
jgi:hypothetical protein